jgi:hypothetical protein
MGPVHRVCRQRRGHDVAGVVEKDGEYYLEFTTSRAFVLSVAKGLLVIASAFASFYALWLLAALFDK